MAELPAIKRRLIEQGVDVIDVGAGDADLAPPRVAVEALARAARDPAMSRYPFQLGLPAFREAAAAYMQRRFGVKVEPFAELHPLLGSKEGIAHLAMALLDAADVGIVPEPGYAVYEGGTRLAGGEPYTADRKSTRLNSSHLVISYAVFCLKKKKSSILVFPGYGQ